MIISHKHKFIYVAIPKTGSQSIRQILNPFADITSRHLHDDPYYHHTRAKSLRDHFKKNGWDWDEYFKFTMVRNPWAHLVSKWKYINQTVYFHENKIEHVNEPFAKRSKQLLTKLDFDFNNFVVYWRDANPQSVKHIDMMWYCDQIEWILDNEDNNLLDYIGKVENFHESVDHITDKIGIPQQQIPHKNKTNHKHYTEYYNDTTRRIVAEKSAKDIEYFNYKFV